MIRLKTQLFCLLLLIVPQFALAQNSDHYQLFNAHEIQWIKDHPIIHIGVDGNWPPIDFLNENNQFMGITADYLNLISKKTDITFIPEKSSSFKIMLQKVMDGELNVGATISFKKERTNTLLFTQPFFHVQKVILTSKDNQNIHNINDLKHKTVAIEDGFLTMRQLQEKHPEIKLLPVKSTLEALKKVSWGQADAYIGNQAVAYWLLLKNQLTNLKISGDPELGSGPQNFAVSKKASDWAPLVGIIDKVLAGVSIEQRQAIENRWLSQTASKGDDNPELVLDNHEKAWLKAHPEIFLGVDKSWKPLEFIDRKGRYSGLSSDFIKYFSQQLGISFQPPEPMPWVMVIKGLQDKTIDIAPMVVKTEKRAEYLNFTEPYLDFPVVIFNRRGETLLGGIADLAGKNVGLVRDYAIAELIHRDYPELRQVKFSNTQAGLNALATGEIEAFIDVLAVGGYLIATEGMSNLQVASSTPYNYPLSIGIRKDWPQLTSILNKAISNIPAQKKNEFLKNWLAVHQAQKIDYTLLSWVLAIAFIIFTLLGFRHREMGKVNTRLKEGQERLALTLESAELGTWEVNYFNNYIVNIEWDETFARHHSLPSDQISLDENDFKRIISSEHADRTLQSLKKYLKGEQDEFKVEYLTRANHRWIASQGRILKRDADGHSRRIVGISQDITESKEAHLQIHRSSQFKSQFLANMSHEIRTPMNAIVGLGHLLSKTKIDDKQANYINNLQKSSQTLLALIDDILDLSKIEAGHLNIESIRFSLEELLNDLANISVIRINKKIEFIYDMATDVPDLLIGDPFRINQVLTNLVSNSIKFTDTGSIILRVSVLHEAQNKDDKVWLQFEVNDTGIGIASDKLDRLFDPFVQEDGSTTRKYGGTGLGLSISRQLVSLMGGSLDAQSIKGEGSRFYFTLPFIAVETKTGLTLLKKSIPDLRGLNVLLVDDNPLSLKILSQTLKSMTFHVTSVASGKQALQLLHDADSRQFDVVLLDWRMPEMDGEKTSILIRKQIPKEKLPIIILMTAYGREAAEEKISHLPLDGFLVKPITPSQLFNAIIQARKGYITKPHKSSDQNISDELLITPLKGHVLLAEDNRINQQVATEILQQMGLMVSICNDGVEVIKTLQTLSPDLILMDIQMPEMDGYQATQTIRQNPAFNSLPIIAMTANAMAEDIKISLQSGMNGHISKPVDPQLLYQTLASYLPAQHTDLPQTPQSTKQHNSQSGLQDWPDSIPGLNIKQGIKQVGGNEQLYQNLLRNFVQTHGQLVDDLEQSLQQNDRAKAKRLIHTIKGVSGNIGAEKLMQAATDIDEAFKHRDTLPDTLVKSLQETCKVLFTNLKPLLNKQPDQQEKAISHHKNKTDKDLQKLRTALQTGDSTSAEIMQKLLPALSTIIEDDSLEKIQSYINDYEFEKAYEWLQKALGINDNE